MRNNPWKNLHLNKKYRFVASCDDVDVLEIYNQTRSNPNEVLHRAIPTSNVIGNPYECKVMILLMNPGFSDADFIDIKNKDFVNAFHNRNDFFLLDNKFSDTTSYKWWKQKLLTPLFKEFDQIASNQIRQKLIQYICNVEYFPYHSKTFSNDLYLLRLPSQEYAFESVRIAIKRKIPIIIAKGKIENWAYQVKEVFNYSHLYKLSSQRNSTISKNNLLERVNPNIDHWTKVQNFNSIINFL